MTGAEQCAVATTRRSIPELASTGLVAPWTGAIPGVDGSVVRGSLADAAALALAASEPGDDPVVLAVSVTGGAPFTVIPWSAVETVLLRSDAAAREFGARAYDNFDPAERPVSVSPAVFEVDSAQLAASGVESPAGLEVADRLAGGASCACAVPVPPTVDAVRDELVQRLVLPGEATPDVLHAFESLLTDDPDDAKLMSAAVEAVLGLDPSAPRGGRRFLSDVAGSIADPHERTVKALDAAQDVLRAKKELHPLRSEVGLRSVKALLLFALRPEPPETVGWSAEMPGDPLSVVAAATLAGLRSGWTRLPVSLRGNSERRRWFESSLADRAGTGAKWSEGLGTPRGEVVQVAPEEPGGRASATEGQVTLESEEAATVADAKADDPLASLKRLAAAADFDDPDVARAAAAVCLKHGWEELVTTVLEVGRRPYAWTGAAVEVVGVPVLRRRIDRAFIERLADFDGRMSTELKALAEVLGVPPKKPARRRKAT